MKKIILTVVLAVLLFNCKAPEKNEYNKNEIIFVVEMESNDSKSESDIAEFSKYYTEAIENKEPNSLGWGFFKSNDKIILIERYLNGAAMMEHVNNISEGGVLETHFGKFMEHFTINKIDVYGTASDELKEYVKPFGLPFYFHPDLAKFSRN
tara:strand:+ start:238 stop:693 length:456 start_codon:yes stop_codon:yes gene_type:complete